MNEAFKELAEFCHKGDDLTLPLLRQKLEAGPDGIIRGDLSHNVKDDTTLLHYVCYNRRVTLEVVQYLVSLYPEAVQVRTGFGWHPLHRACNNNSCPDEVVEYLVGLYPDALSVSWPHRGLPLHCLLSRQAREEDDEVEVLHPLNLDLVRMLVQAHPEALTNQENSGANTPLLRACQREDLSMDMVRLLLDPDLLVLGLGGNYGGEIPLVALMNQYHSAEGWRPPFDVVRFFIKAAPHTLTLSTLNTICCSRNVTLEIVKLFIETWPDVSLLDQADDKGMLPLHSLCLNDNKKDQDSWLLPIIEYFVNAYPEAVRERNNYGFLPLSYAIGTTLKITKFLVEKYPESVFESTRSGTMFHSSCRNGGIETVKYLYEKNPDAINVSGLALHLPFEYGRDVEAKVNFLLEKDPRLIRAKDPSNGNLPLHKACSGYDLDLSLIKRLFKLYPDAVATRNLEGRYPLHEFLARDRLISEMEDNNRGKEALETVIFLVTEFPSSVSVADGNGMLPLHHASKYYNVFIVMYLTKAYPDGAYVESPKFGLPLHCASGQQKSGLPIVAYILSLYPEAIGVKNQIVGLPLECTNSAEIFQYLLAQRYSGKTVFFLHHVLQDVAVLNPVSVVRDFLRHFRGNVMQIDNFGQYPLHVAVSSSRASQFVVEEFLSIHQAAAVHQDKQGCTPLHLFLRHSTSMEDSACKKILEELLSKGASSPKVPDNNGSLPLHFACRHGSGINTLVALIESFPGAVTSGDRNGCIPLHVACRRGLLPVNAIGHLLAIDNMTAKVVDNDLELPLHKACRGGHLEIIHHLLDQFEPASGMRNASGSLPIHILCQKKWEDRYIHYGGTLLHRDSLEDAPYPS